MPSTADFNTFNNIFCQVEGTANETFEVLTPDSDELFSVYIYPGAGEIMTVRSNVRKRQYRPRQSPSHRNG
jgi:hypothetical protein